MKTATAQKYQEVLDREFELKVVPTVCTEEFDTVYCFTSIHEFEDIFASMTEQEIYALSMNYDLDDLLPRICD